MGVRSLEEVKKYIEMNQEKLIKMVDKFSEDLKKEFPYSNYAVFVYPEDMTVFDLLKRD
jgi:hypothetical protein